MFNRLGAKFCLVAGLYFFLTIPAFSAELHHVKQIISGDILMLENGQMIRLIGVDTHDVKNKYKKLGAPKQGAEPKVYGSAESFISDTVGEAPVEVEIDKIAGEKDSNGNLLAYVYIDVPKEIWSGFDHTSSFPEIIKTYKYMDEQFIYDKKTHRIFLNGSLIWSGNGVVNNERPFKYAEDFKSYQAEAMKKGRGQWPSLS